MKTFSAARIRVFLLLLLLPVMAVAQEQTWKLNLKDADIRAFVTQVADITGYSFVVDPRVKGKVTVLSSAPMNKEEIYDLFLSVLQVHGFTAISGEEVIKIVQQVDAKQSAESLDRFQKIPSEQLITRVIPVENGNALELVPILRPLVAKYGHLAGVAAANALIVSDHSSNIRRIEEIVRRLDKPANLEVEVIQLDEAWVGDMVKLLKELAPAQLGQQGGGSGQSGKQFSVTADERSNRLIIRGDDAFRTKIRGLIEQLDQPSASGGTTKVIRLNHAKAKDLAELVKGVMGQVVKENQQSQGGGSAGGSQQNQGFAVFADEGTNSLVVRGEPSVMQEVDAIVSSLDVRRAQVMIEAAIVEVSDEVGRDLGVQLAAGDQSGESVPIFGTNFSNVGRSIADVIGAIATDELISPASGGISIGAGREDSNGVTWGVLLQALSTSTSANLLSTPSIITLDNQESEIVVGQNVPFVTGQTTNTSAGLNNPFQTIERKDVGLTLKVTPSINKDELVRLKVEQTTESIADSIDSASDIVTNKREIKTTVLADDGETIALGGLIREDYTLQESKVPLLGDIPLLGELFSSESRRKIKRNLLVFLRPTILLEKGDSVAATQRKYDSLWDVNLTGEREEGESTEQPDINTLFESNELRQGSED
ncbi:type II secretion system protein GspD [Tamilnaduibacter salinus]|uniref:Type II secretion system protein GspD n=1 Tax=Tamilnaduibacter salinus TaxID=1484056 RepID=A0A2A2I316_9GAMM|nr:type II secretion system secretin GspD [Tamilnaduibacter salinus]PAV25706.1 type II secretion system protein GspD [Tamilnaduibacter salinus]